MTRSGFISELGVTAGVSEPSVVVLRLTDRAVPLWSHEPDRPLSPASMIKVPIAAALAVACARGEARLEDRIRVDAGCVTTNDAPSPFVAGYEATLEEAARAMLAASDNVATNVLIDVLGRERITATVRAELGLASTFVRRKLSGSLPLIADPEATGRNAHPAADAAALFARIDAEREGRFAFVYDALLAQIWNDKLSRGLRPGDVFAHKTGDTDEVSHDGGILALPDGRRFALAVYTALPSTPESDARLASFGRGLRAALADEAG
jgi:beta-lactamase class A